MTEPDVALTDYALAMEAVLLLMLLWRGSAHRERLRFWFSLYFASVIIASVCGGTVHGFFLDEGTVGHAILWPAALLTTGVTALAAWAIGARLLLSERAARRVITAAVIQFGIYSLVLVQTQDFRIAIAVNVPAVVWLLIAFVLTYRREGHNRLLIAAAGVTLMLLAALLQQFRVGIHPTYFNYNALYHVLHGIALFLFYRGGHWLIAAEKNAPADPADISTDERGQLKNGDMLVVVEK